MRKRLCGAKCAILSCGRSKSDKTCRLFRFPNQGNPYYKLWMDQCDNDFDHKSAIIKFICDKHFDGKWFGKKKLIKGAIPTLNLKNVKCREIEPFHKNPPLFVYSGPRPENSAIFFDWESTTSKEKSLDEENENNSGCCSKIIKNEKYYKDKSDRLAKLNKILVHNNSIYKKKIKLSNM